jgi:hypothetical protein
VQDPGGIRDNEAIRHGPGQSFSTVRFGTSVGAKPDSLIQTRPVCELGGSTQVCERVLGLVDGKDLLYRGYICSSMMWMCGRQMPMNQGQGQ